MMIMESKRFIQFLIDPEFRILLNVININNGRGNQNLVLFTRRKTISGATLIKGVNQFPNPLIIKDITIKKS